jgi:hypothetical protein
LKFSNGSSTTAITGAGAGALVPSWETLYLNDSIMALTTAAWTITQAGNFGNVILTKSGTGAGVPLVINNAGTGNDLNIVNTNGEAVGVKISTDVQSASAADNDTIFYLSVNGNSDTPTTREYGSIKFIADDVSDGTEDASFAIATMVGGTSRTILSMTAALTLLGYGAAATISSQGAYDLVLETNSGTNSGTITITDGAAGAIALAPDTTGVVTISTGLQVGGTTPTASIFNVAGSGGGGTTGYGFKVNVTTLTTGTALLVDSAVSSSGLLLDLQLASTSVFKVDETGATTILGAAGANVITVSNGDVLMSDGSLTITDADAAVSFIVTNSAATTLGNAADTGIASLVSESLTTGVLLNLSLDETNLTSGGSYLRCWGQDAAANVFQISEYGSTTITTTGNVSSLAIASGSTTADVLSIATTALTTGDAIQVTSTAETLAAGELLKINNTENGDISATPKTGNLVSITSSVTSTTASASLDYDAMLITRSNIANEAGQTLTAAGSVLKLMNTSTDTAGTCTDSTVGLEVLMVDGGTAAPTGTAVDITSVGVGAKALNITSASTTVSDVLITGSGVKANNKASLEVTNSGATAAGGSILRVTNTGTPAAATSYLVDFDYGGATMTNNPVTVYINGKDSTAAALQVTGSGASAGGLVELNSTATGALGAVLKFDQTANSAADNDVIGRLLFTAQDDANAAETYGRIDCLIQDKTAANPDASFNFLVDRAGTATLALTIGWDDTAGAAINGISVGDSAGAAIVTSNGTQDLVLETNGGTNSSTITLTDAANGDITVAINGTGNFVAQNLTYETNAGSPVTGTTTLTWGDAEGQVVFCTSAGGAYSITLPAAATAGAGAWYTFIKTDADANAITLDANGAETIGEAGSAMAETYAVIDAIHDTVTIVCDGTSWYVTAQNIS